MAETYSGVLHFFSETGTEGGYWAFQDSKFITSASGDPVNKHCQRCYRWWEDAANTPEPSPSFTYYLPDREEGGKKYTDGYHSFSEPVEGGQTTFKDEEPGSFNDEWTKDSNARALECYSEGHNWLWVPVTDQWSYEGLIILKDGDKLTVLDPENGIEILFETVIKLVQQPDQYSEDAVTAGGMISHSYPDKSCLNGITFNEWCTYFFSECPAVISRSS